MPNPKIDHTFSEIDQCHLIYKFRFFQNLRIDQPKYMLTFVQNQKVEKSNNKMVKSFQMMKSHPRNHRNNKKTTRNPKKSQTQNQSKNHQISYWSKKRKRNNKAAILFLLKRLKQRMSQAKTKTSNRKSQISSSKKPNIQMILMKFEQIKINQNLSLTTIDILHRGLMSI